MSMQDNEQSEKEERERASPSIWWRAYCRGFCAARTDPEEVYLAENAPRRCRRR